jgi:hypothetical protein
MDYTFITFAMLAVAFYFSAVPIAPTALVYSSTAIDPTQMTLSGNDAHTKINPTLTTTPIAVTLFAVTLSHIISVSRVCFHTRAGARAQLGVCR